jgi:putative SOS response-associated peptidase YedK
MCGRFALHSGQETLALHFDSERLPDAITPEPSYNIPPTRWQPVVVAAPPAGIQGDAPRHMRPMQWGLLPSWAKQMSGGHRPFNARSETAHEKPTFRSSFTRRRCIVPADGWFEWTKTVGGKQPHWIHPLDERPLALAGLWSSWSSTTGDAIESFTILTCEAAEHLSSLHHRMPVLIAPEDWAAWLDPSVGSEVAMELVSTDKVHPCALNIDHFAVAKSVNSVANDGPNLITPLPTLD